MKANQSRQSPAEWEESAPLLSQAVRDLPTGRHEFHKERLMAYIQQDIERDEIAAATGPARSRTRGFRPLRPVFALPAMALVVGGAVAAGTMLNGGDEGAAGVATGPALTTRLGSTTTEGVPQLLDQISLVAADEARQAVEPGQYVYIKSKSADTFVKTVDGKGSLVSHVLHERQLWKSADGTKGWLIDPAVNDSPEGETLSLPDEKGKPFEASVNGPSYDFLTTLPTDPDQLLKLIYKETKGKGNSPDQEAFGTIGDLLGESYPPADLYPALFKAAAKIPGVVVVNEAQDAIGRSGVAVARVDETSGARDEWIFDRKTHVFLGERSVQVREISGDAGVVIKPGTILYTSAVTDRAVVGGIKETPAHSG
ncbi:CU044_5270 family protein [Streptomyces sp. SID2888]|uniref:CU044_5270 family protein n=1 Tax=Streptomyces sp. SID2888 TaxID=2690256 RepID=UPI00136DFFAF|nr:CU044_5270 family protein [Streptomyces sp. SID2888]MYV50452.1 hypothetical protein [Streptomyces sp. SID2888]